jgi:hypothetical protein
MKNVQLARGKRSILFLSASFFSSVGDTLLLFAVPAGLSIETGDIRNAVLMWLIPAVAVFFSSFLTKKIENREHSARSDYAKLILIVAVIELCIAALCSVEQLKPHTILLISLFIFGYAFIKEGIPRLFYNISQYRYFVDPSEYTKVAGINHGLSIVAGIVGAALSAGLVMHGYWRVAIVFDAITFLVFGLTILFFGIDPKFSQTHINNNTAEIPELKHHSLNVILLSVTLLPIANSLVANYIPILSEKLSIVSTSLGIILVGALRLPGALAGLYISNIHKTIDTDKIIFWLPILNILLCIILVTLPSLTALLILTLCQGLISGLYWPTDFAIRNCLPHNQLVKFNTLALRRLAVYQFLACICAVIIFKNETLAKGSIILAMILLVCVAKIHSNKNKSKLEKIGIFKTALLFFLAFEVTACNSKISNKSEHHVLLHSLTRKMELSIDLTYSAFIILNETSAHLLKMSKNLTLEPILLKSYKKNYSGHEYELTLNSAYRSFRGEGLDAKDVAYSLKYLISEKSPIAGVLTSIVGADQCKSHDCELRGLKVLSKERLLIKLKKQDEKFIEKITSPWLVLFKEGKPLLEKIGDCTLPYQTGKAHIIACDTLGIHVEIDGQIIILSEKESYKTSEHSRYEELVNDNPGVSPSPTLTTLAAFANPKSKILTSHNRIAFLKMLRRGSKAYANEIKLNWSPLLVPHWLSIDPTKELLDFKISNSITCPKAKIKVLLDTSLPNLEFTRNYIKNNIPCEIVFTITKADNYFKNFNDTDIGIAWFTPDYLDLYNVFSAFDCTSQGACYFNWHDDNFQHTINSLRELSQRGIISKKTAIALETQILNKGYAAPIAEMNWWIKGPEGIRPIHTAGLAQMSLSDFL